MSKVIDYLEMMGKDASLRHATSTEIEADLARAHMDPELTCAIIENDREMLESLLGAKPIVCCAIAPSKEDDEKEEEPSKEDEITSMMSFERLASAA